jgi:peptide-methionine (R)-S-oxide reductase
VRIIAGVMLQRMNASVPCVIESGGTVHRRQLLKQGIALIGLAVTWTRAAGRDFPPLERNLDWTQVLTPEQFDVLFRQETEFAGSSPLLTEKRPGVYLCAACHLPLFLSAHKYDSGTGWPSFTQSIAGRTATRIDSRRHEPLVEYHCARCGGHQGHIFKDGPPPRRERWCNNGLALNFIPDGQAMPAMRG